MSCSHCFDSQVDLCALSAHASEPLHALLCRTQELVSKLRLLQADRREFVCLKYLLLFSPGEFCCSVVCLSNNHRKTDFSAK